MKAKQFITDLMEELDKVGVDADLELASSGSTKMDVLSVYSDHGTIYVDVCTVGHDEED